MAQVKELGAPKATPVIFDMTSRECLWSKVGVVQPRICHNAFDCLSCAFDRRMSRLGNQYQAPWSHERWLATPPDERFCRHMLTGRVSFKLCMNSYQCSSCPYDQNIEEETLYSPAEQVGQYPAGPALAVAKYYYHPGHVWARVEYGGRVRVGLDDFAARVFGPADAFQLPEIGSRLSTPGQSATFQRGENQAVLQTPVQGAVVARNPRVMADPGLAAESPHGQGWLLLLEPASLQKDLKGLISGPQVEKWLLDEAQRLSDLLTEASGYRLAATGGMLRPDLFGSMPGLSWQRLAEGFLGA